MGRFAHTSPTPPPKYFLKLSINSERQDDSNKVSNVIVGRTGAKISRKCLFFPWTRYIEVLNVVVKICKAEVRQFSSENCRLIVTTYTLNLFIVRYDFVSYRQVICFLRLENCN